MKKSAQYLFWFSLALSLLIHIFFAGGAAFLESLRGTKSIGLSPKNNAQKTEVALISPEELKKLLEKQTPPTKTKGQVVDQETLPEKQIKPKEARYLSKNDQNVEKEMVASQSGKFQNKESSQLKGATNPTQALIPQSEKTSQIQRKNLEPKADTADAPQQPNKLTKFETYKEGEPSPLKKFLPTVSDSMLKHSMQAAQNFPQSQGSPNETSQTLDSVREVQKGPRTMLNSREFIYYSYYSRIKDRLHQYWEPKIRAKMIKVLRSGRQLASSRDRVTSVVIILNEKGLLEQIQLMESSGLRDLDDGALEAFQAAAPFPNPPKGIEDADGKIRIRWSFVIES